MKRNRTSVPDFLVIGAQKSATTWLFHCLLKHPEIYLPPVKEVHYFDRSVKYPSPNFLTIRSPFKRYTLKEFLTKLRSIAKDELRVSNLDRFFWELKYSFGYYNDKWYISIFKPTKENQKCGEITPSYSILDVEDIKKVYKFNPDLKIVFLMRNPIDRAWSAFLMSTAQQNKDYKKITDSEAFSYFKSEEARKRGDYSTIIKNWTSVFPENQFYFGFFEDVKCKPKKLFTDILKHIGVSKKIDWDTIPLNKKIHGGQKVAIPNKYYKFLCDMYQKEIKSLYKEQKNPLIKSWINE